MSDTSSSIPGMSAAEFRKYGHQVIDWIADYREQCERFPVRSQVQPGYLSNLLPSHAPEDGEAFEDILKDIDKCIVPGITNWESPNFFAYFKPHSSYPSCLGELLCQGFNAMGFSWISSPACTELETITLDWLAKGMQLPEAFLSTSNKGGGVIQGSAGEAFIVALLAAKNRNMWIMSDVDIGNSEQKEKRPEPVDATKYIVYVSDQTHSIAEKACKVVGLAPSQFRRIKAEIENDFCMEAADLEAAINEDKAKGCIPLLVCATVGTTSSTAIENLVDIGKVVQKYNAWMHCDAAYAGAFALCDEYQHIFKGIEYVDSLSVNAHKSLLVSFDCAPMYVRERRWLIQALSLNPENEAYLQNEFTKSGEVIDYKDWQVPLGRRFRALKLWFVIRSYGLKGLRHHLRCKVANAKRFEEHIFADQRFELFTKRTLSLVCFRLKPQSVGDDPKALDTLNTQLLDALNKTGKIFLISTVLDDRVVLRLACGGVDQPLSSIDQAWQLIQETANSLCELGNVN